jgi:cytochrome c oxidase subunit 2
MPVFMRPCLLVLSCLALAAGGCAGAQSALDSAGPQASGIEKLFWLFLGVSVLVQVAVTLALLPPIRRRGRGAAPPPLVEVEPRRERNTAWVVSTLVLLTTATLGVLLVGDFITGNRAHAAHAEPAPLKIAIIGRQWWWDIRYVNDAEPYKTVHVANEIHLPVGQIVEFHLDSADVIHSFWVPNLHGKKDMIPGHRTTLRLHATRPGTYYGQCAEFCGLQHAKMRLTVVVEPKEQYDAWIAAQGQPAKPPETESQKRGQQIFLGTSCVMCHEIAGTPARSQMGPVLTHLASRPTLGAGAMPNNRGNLAGWILDPHTAKPGVRMPQNVLGPADLHALLDYLESLK